ncbi:MAG: ATP-binding protein [archaeon]|nr:ATP-binding protein [archaeon]
MTGRKFGETYKLTITDYGQGMKLEEITNIGAFMQFDRDAREQQGLGLGLAICQRIIKLHEGTLNIESEYGEKTTVTITFKCK